MPKSSHFFVGAVFLILWTHPRTKVQVHNQVTPVSIHDKQKCDHTSMQCCSLLYDIQENYC